MLQALGLKGQAALQTGHLKEKAAEAAALVQYKLPEPVKDTTAQAAGQVRAKAGEAGQLWKETVPEPVRDKTAQGARLARENPKVLPAASGAQAVMVWLGRRRKGRER